MAKHIQERQASTAANLRHTLSVEYQRVRTFSEKLCETLETEDYVIQSMPDVSPTKWHLAHTTWFFETFLLTPFIPNYTSPHPQYTYLFNSYYNTLGQRHCRPKRGLISRPTVQEVYDYRKYADEIILSLLESCDDQTMTKMSSILTLGLHHEQQHQELMVTDIKHVLSCNPLHPVYRPAKAYKPSSIPPITWKTFSEELTWIGYTGNGFFYDNEGPRHCEFVHSFQLASRLITNGEYFQFIQADGYTNPLLWLSDGWRTVQEEEWSAPLYWEKQDRRWFSMTLNGLREIDMSEPVCHVSYFEADAFARWAGARLPTEAEWEVAARDLPITGNFVEQGFYHPVPLYADSSQAQDSLLQMYGDVWEWTQSQYEPYPGYRPAPGAIGEYNGKFMCNQFVLRGGSCATAQTHIRPTYRNFFPPDARWQFMGIRLAREV